MHFWESVFHVSRKTVNYFASPAFVVLSLQNNLTNTIVHHRHLDIGSNITCLLPFATSSLMLTSISPYQSGISNCATGVGKKHPLHLSYDLSCRYYYPYSYCVCKVNQLFRNDHRPNDSKIYCFYFNNCHSPLIFECSLLIQPSSFRSAIARLIVASLTPRLS